MRIAYRPPVVAQVMCVSLIAFLPRFLGLSSYPLQFDEFYHLLAGQSFMHDGSFGIYDGSYSRGAGYTAIIGTLFRIFGTTSPLLARVPALIAGTLIPTLVFSWMAKHCTLRAAWLAALMLCFVDDAITFSRIARFYMMQSLLIWIGGALIYDLLRNDGRGAAWRIPLAGLTLLFAIHLQITTIFAIGALAIFCLGDFAYRPWLRRMLAHRYTRFLLIVCALVALSLLILALVDFWPKYRSVAMWNEANVDNGTYYIAGFLKRWLTLTLLFPLAIAFSWVRLPRLISFCAVMFVIPFVGQSFGGMKEFRYLLYALPYFFVIWAIAIDQAVRPVYRWVQYGAGYTTEAAGRRPAPKFRSTVAASLTALVVSLALLANASFRQAVKASLHLAIHGAKSPVSLIKAPPDDPWQHARELDRALALTGLFITAEDVRTIYYVRPFDLSLNRSRISDIKPSIELGIDFRTGHRVIGSASYLRQVVSCYASGTILIPEARWRVNYVVPNDMADATEKIAKLTSPRVPGFRIYRWHHDLSNSASCVTMRKIIGATAR